MDQRRVSHYRLGEPLGGGAMGRVYKAEDTLLGRTVALKFLAPHLASDPASVDRFLREARMMADLDHPHICTVHEIGQDADGRWFIAMAWYDGVTLKERLAAGRLTPERALAYARQTAEGLSCAHAHGIVHRDVKPANLIVTDRDEVKILDFGIARLLGDTRHTQPGALVGTVGYLAPEQTRGEEVTAAADIWSLGVVLFEMLAGRLPFAGEHAPALLYAIAHEEPDTLPLQGDGPARHGALIAARCLAKDPADRYPSARALADDLARAEGGTAPEAGTRARRRPGTLVLALAALAALAAGVVGGMRLASRHATPAVDTTGVAVLPFAFLGGAGEELGQGLAWCLTDRLRAYDRASDAFWLVPPGEVPRYEVRDADDARLHLGAYRSVSGSGSVSGSTVSLHLEILDGRTGERQAREFHDTFANLGTWQRELAGWVAAALDPALAGARAPARAHGGTPVPAAYLAFVRAMGHRMLEARDGPARRDSARTLLAAAVAADSAYAQARCEYGWSLWDRHRADDPARAEAGRRHVAAAARLDTLLAWAPYFAGMIDEAGGRPGAAEAGYRSALSRDPAHAYSLERLAGLLDRQGRGEEADALLARAVAARPGYAPAYLALGTHDLLRTGDYAGAAAALRELVAIAPRNHLGWEYLGVALFYGDEPGAEQMFRRSLAIRETASCFSNLGTFYYYHRRFQDAIDAYQRALALGPGRYDLWRNLAEAYRWSPGYADSSLAAYGRAVAMGESRLAGHPDDTRLLAELASFHAYLGHRERAGQILARLTAGEPPTGDAAFTLAAAYEDLGRRDEALASLERALDTGTALPQIEEYPGFRNLRSDARYQDLIRRHR